MENLLEKYRQYRRIGNDLLTKKIVPLIPPPIIQQAAKRLGLFKKKAIYLNQEEELSLLMDYTIFHTYIQEKNQIMRYLERHSETLNLIEKEMLGYMQNAYFSIVSVKKILNEGTLLVDDILYEEEYLLIDEGLYSSGSIGFTIASTLLNIGGFRMTGGAAVPLTPIITDLDDLFLKTANKFQKKYSHFNKDEQAWFITSLLKKCIAHQVLEFIQYT